MRTLFTVLVIASLFTVAHLQTVQDGLSQLPADCHMAFMKQLSLDLVEQWNCFNSSNLVDALDIPGLEWHDLALPVLQREFHDALKTVITDILYNSNVADECKEGVRPSWYVYKAYETLPMAMGAQYYFANGKCNVSLNAVSHPIESLFELGSMISILPYHPTKLETDVWNDQIAMNALIYINDPTMSKYRYAKPYPSLPYYTSDGKLVLHRVSGTWGQQMSNLLLQRALMAYGIPYSASNLRDNKLTVRETNIVQSDTMRTTYYARQLVNGAAVWVEKEYNVPTDKVYTVQYTYPRPVVSQTLNIQSFKYYHNVNNPADEIAWPQNNTIDYDTQNKLLTKTPSVGYRVTTCNAPSVVCSDKQPIDIIFAIDGSSEISVENFLKEVKLVSDVIDRLPVGHGTVRLGVVMYSSTIESFELYEFASADEAKEKVGKMNKPNGKNDIVKGFDAVKSIYGNSNAAVRGKGVPKVLVLVTASHPEDDDASIYAAVDSVHDLGVNVAVIGVNTANSYTDAELEYFATDPRTRNVVKIGSFEMDVILDKLLTETCKLPAKVGNETTVSTSVWPSTTENFEFLTGDGTYDLMLQVDGTVMIRMFYYDDPRIPTTYDYDLEFYCDGTCAIPIPAVDFTWSAPITRENVAVQAGKPVIVSVEFLGTPGAREVVPQAITFNAVAHDPAQISPYTTSSQPFAPASQEEIDASEVQFLLDFGFEQEGDDAADDDAAGSAVPMLAVVGAVAGVVVLAGAIAGVVFVRRNHKTVSEPSPVPAPRLDSVVTGTPEVEVDSIRADKQTSAVKRLNSSRHLNELAK
jgi:hypothetical protein